MGKFVKNLMEEKEDKYTHTQKPKPRQRIGCRRKDNYGWGSFKLAADSRRKTTRLDDAESKNGWQRKEEHNGCCRCCHLPNILFRKCNLEFKKK